LFEDSHRNLWVGTETAGVALVLATDPRIRAFDLGKGNREERLVSACEDTQGAVWLYTADGQLCRYRDGRADVWSFDADRFSTYRAIICDRTTGKIWVATDSKLSAVDRTASGASRDLAVNDELRLVKIDFVLASQKDGFWV